jgi:ankyrin repeat protein
MTIKILSSLWMAVLAMATETNGDTWPQLLLDVGNYPDIKFGALALDLSKGVNPNTVGPNGWTALHIAAGLDKPIMTAILREKGRANPDIQDSSSYTPLHVATGLGHLDVINQLISSANTEIKGPNQWTALHVAAANGFTDAVIVLLTTSTNVNAADSNGWTPLHLAVGGNHLPAVTAILAAPAT